MVGHTTTNRVTVVTDKGRAAPPARSLNRRDLGRCGGRPPHPPDAQHCQAQHRTNVIRHLIRVPRGVCRRWNGNTPVMTESPNYDLAARMAELARTSAAPRTVNEVLGDVTATAQELITGVDTAGVLMIGKGGKWDSFGGTSDLPHVLDELQMTYGEGPCAEAALDEVIVRTDDFRTEERWPKYSPEAVKLGVLSGLSFKLYTANRTAGALNLFAFKPHA